MIGAGSDPLAEYDLFERASTAAWSARGPMG